MRVVWIALSLFALPAAGISSVSGAWMLQTGGVAATSPCANLPHSDHPKVTLTDGKMEAVVFLPDKDNGYYRSTRFDWSGVVGCVAVSGHRFFGEWFENYDPLKNDAIVGPVEEFRTDDGVMGHYPPSSPLLTMQAEAIGYDDAKPGDAFLKPGVGMLQRVSDKPYSFGTLYPIVNGGTWSIPRQTRKSITFQQVLNGSNGYAYVYTKTLSLDGPGSRLTLEHTLKNTGTRTIDTKVYDHDFIVFDGQPVGPGMVVRFKFEPKPVDPLGDTVRIEGKEISFLKPIGRQAVSGYLTGYSSSPSDYDFTVEDTTRKMGVEQTSDTPISRIYFWSNGRAVCPEAYLHVPANPGQTSHWKIHYRFFAPS
jgi:hypothetical protein